MQMTLEMPQVAACTEQTCGYNVDGSCHSLAITVGDTEDPKCDTYIRSPLRRRAAADIAGVGACKIAVCRYNEDYVCTADMISVVHRASGPGCATFER